MFEQHITSHTPMTKITILYFAAAKDATGVPQDSITLPTGKTTLTVPELIEKLIAKHPQLAKIFDAAMLAVNMEYVNKDGTPTEGGKGSAPVEIKPEDEVAVIPPLSGG